MFQFFININIKMELFLVFLCLLPWQCLSSIKKYSSRKGKESGIMQAVDHFSVAQYSFNEIEGKLSRLRRSAVKPRIDLTSKKQTVQYGIYSKSVPGSHYHPLPDRRLKKPKDPQEHWLPGFPVKIIIHGWTNQVNLDSATNLKNQGIWDIARAYTLKLSQCNIVVVDWTSLSTEIFINYHVAAQGALTAAEDVADFVKDMKEKGQIKSLGDVHIIGVSLGAHLAGRAGYHINLAGGDKLGRITGIDPMGAAFAYTEHISGTYLNLGYAHLSKDDAEFVDILHCNQGHLAHGQWGSASRVGHADIIVNGGTTQPGCNLYTDFQGCSHLKCPLYWRDSIAKDYRNACKTIYGPPLAPPLNTLCAPYTPGCPYGRNGFVRNRFGRREVQLRSRPRRFGLWGRSDDDACVGFGEHCPSGARGVYYVVIL